MTPIYHTYPPQILVFVWDTIPYYTRSQQKETVL